MMAPRTHAPANMMDATATPRWRLSDLELMRFSSSDKLGCFQLGSAQASQQVTIRERVGTVKALGRGLRFFATAWPSACISSRPLSSTFPTADSRHREPTRPGKSPNSRGPPSPEKEAVTNEGSLAYREQDTVSQHEPRGLVPLGEPVEHNRMCSVRKNLQIVCGII